MKRITLEAWAERQFDPVPTIATLLAWARKRRIQPEPVKVGRAWYVEEHAQYGRAASKPAEQTMRAPGMSDRAWMILSVAGV